MQYAGVLGNAARGHSTPGFIPAANHSFWSFTRLLFPGTDGTILAVALTLLALAAVVAMGRSKMSFEGAYALATVVGILISPHVLVHDLSVCLLAATVVAVLCRADFAAPVLVCGDVVAFLSQPLAEAWRVQFSVLAMVATAVLLWRASKVTRVKQRCLRSVESNAGAQILPL